MIERVSLPRFAETMEDAVLACWRVAEGDAVEAGQVVCDVTVDKATLEVTLPAAGVVRALLAEEDDILPVGAPLLLVGDPDEPIPEELRERPAVEKRNACDAILPLGVREAAVPLERGLSAPGVKDATDEAAALAETLAVPLLAVPGNGPKGRVEAADVQAYADAVKDLPFAPGAREAAVARNVDLRDFHGVEAEAITTEMVDAAAPLTGGVTEPFNALRAILCRRLATSFLAAPHFYVTTAVDMTAAGDLRKQLRREKTPASYNDMLIKASALALRKFPRVASVFTPEGYRPRDRMHIGFAVALGDDALLVPVVRDADRLPLVEVAQETKRLVDKARSRTLTPDDFTGGVFSVSNLGMQDVDHFAAIVNPGESSILAVGKMQDTPVAVRGEVVVRPLLKMTLSSDHRTVDGILAAKFNSHLKELLEHPERLL